MMLLTEKEIRQIKYIMTNAIETRRGVVCLYRDMLLIADTPEELHNILKIFWDK